jgi:hypothetical protein
MKKCLLILLFAPLLSYPQFQEDWVNYHDGNFGNYIGGRVATALRNQPTIVDFVYDYIQYNIYMGQNPAGAAAFLNAINARLGSTYDTLPRLGVYDELWGARNIYTPEGYSAIGDDDTDDTDEILDLFSAIPDNSTILFSGGKYIYSGITPIVYDSSVNILFTNNSWIDGTSFTGIDFLKFSGEGFTDCIDQTNTISEDDQYIVNSALADSLVADDLFIISTSATVGGNGEEWRGRKGLTKGEICEVWYISNDTIFLKEAIYEDYPACRACRYEYITVVIDGLDYRTTNNTPQEGFDLSYLKNSIIQN